MTEIEIDLSSCETSEQVLLKIGGILELGGPNGNFKCQPYIYGKPGRGWGVNWDALNDSLSYLDTGGIWGSSKKFLFPLKLIFLNWLIFKKKSPEQFRILEDILHTKKILYAKHNKNFYFKFE